MGGQLWQLAGQVGQPACLAPFWRLAVAVATAALWLHQAAASPDRKEPENADIITQDVRYIWPLYLWSIPLTPYPGIRGPAVLEDDRLMNKLAFIGEQAFDRYRQQVLPVELKADPVFAADFAQLDGSRMNMAFARWQKRVFAHQKRVAIEELSHDGRPIPRYRNVSYEWPELYEAKEYKLLRRHIAKTAVHYVSSMGKEDDISRQKLKIFIWAEVYRQADSQKPTALTGVPIAGIVFARYLGHARYGGNQKFNFEDPRGINPPFGRTHSHQPRQGEMLMYPSWASTFITPNPVNRTNVFFRFLCYPAGGARDFDWEDDPTGDYIYRKQYNIKRPGKRKKAPDRTEL